MKKIGFMIVYNDADYVEYAIRSVKGWVDKLIIVEGAFEITIQTGKPPRSDDGTLEIVSSFVDNKRVFLENVNLREHKHHYDVGYQWAIDQGADWAVMIDSDEVWTDLAKKKADLYMNVKWAHELRVHEKCFINDFNHWYRGTYPRIFKCIPGSKFVFDNEVQFSGFERGAHNVSTIQGRDIFHYGYVRRKKRWQLKQDYMKAKDGNPILEQYKLQEDTYIIPSDIPIYEFDGDHPEIMKNHPFYGRTAKEIIHG